MIGSSVWHHKRHQLTSQGSQALGKVFGLTEPAVAHRTGQSFNGTGVPTVPYSLGEKEVCDFFPYSEMEERILGPWDDVISHHGSRLRFVLVETTKQFNEFWVVRQAPGT